MKTFNILPVSKKLEAELQNKIDFKTKPLGALGVLEKIALQIGLIQNTLSPELKNPHIVVFAGDHGIAKEGVSAYPQEVTFQMVMNFLNGGSAINVFCKQNKIDIKVVDAGVNYDFPEELNLINAKIDRGTKCFLQEPAMSIEATQKALNKGAEIVKQIYTEKCNIIGFGEMGIGNTSSSSILMSLLADIPVEECVGRGAGLDDNSLKNKKEILSQALQKHSIDSSVTSVLATFGGFEISMISGAILQAAELGMIVMIDGFIVTSALLVASKLNANVLDYCIFTHTSEENGHKKLLQYLNAKPILNLNMRLGEGTGAAVAYPIIKSAVNFLNEMASFESAGVSNKG